MATCLPRGGERERRRRKKEKEEPSDKLLLSSFLSLLFPTFRLRDGRCSPTTFDKLLFQTENRPLLPCSSSRLSARLFPHSSRNSWRGGGGDCSFQRSRGAGSGSKKLGDGQGDHFNRTRTAFGNTEKWDITNGIKDYSFGGNALIGRLSGTGAQQSTDRSENGTVGQPFRGCQSWRAVIDRKVGRFTSSTVASSLLAAYLGKFVDDSSVPLFSISFSVLAHPPDDFSWCSLLALLQSNRTVLRVPLVFSVVVEPSSIHALVVHREILQSKRGMRKMEKRG